MRYRPALAPLLFACLAVPVLAEPAQPLTAAGRMPIREVTVFKDGHAFVSHRGSMPTDATGHVLLDALPQPVLGTFWTYSADKDVKLLSVTANQRKVKVERTAITLDSLIEANVGADVIVTEAPETTTSPQPAPYVARIVGRPAISGEELEATSPPNSGPKLPVKGSLVLLKTEQGTRVVDLDRIRDLTFKGDHKAAIATEEFRNLLTLQFRWPDGRVPKQADVGMSYVQKGIRWIPNYKVTLDGSGHAVVRLQATIVNELADLEDVTANLVVGVPSFAYADTLDPMALQQTAAQLSQYFQQQQGGMQMNLSNAIMSQAPGRMTERRGRVVGGGQGAVAEDQQGPVDLGPDLGDSGKAEDFFIYTLNHVTLPKGGRVVVPVAEFTLPVTDRYTLDIPFVPPAPVARRFDTQQQQRLAALAAAPKVDHEVRLTNDSRFPLTTAPALIFSGDRVLAQTTMTYTPPGSEVDLGLSTAVDVKVKKSDNETQRTPNAATWNDEKLTKIDLAGKVTLVSYAKRPIEVKVVRHVLGKVGEAGEGGKAEMVNVLEDGGSDLPEWYSWRSWPDWWARFNGVGRITWTAKLEPGKPQDLTYTWSYYWR